MTPLRGDRQSLLVYRDWLIDQGLEESAGRLALALPLLDAVDAGLAWLADRNVWVEDLGVRVDNGEWFLSLFHTSPDTPWDEFQLQDVAAHTSGQVGPPLAWADDDAAVRGVAAYLGSPPPDRLGELAHLMLHFRLPLQTTQESTQE